MIVIVAYISNNYLININLILKKGIIVKLTIDNIL